MRHLYRLRAWFVDWFDSILNLPWDLWFYLRQRMNDTRSSNRDAASRNAASAKKASTESQQAGTGLKQSENAPVSNDID